MPEAANRNRTLVVDDDPVVRRMWQRSLELAHYDVVVAASGAEGLQRLHEDGSIALVLLDLMMPGMDGWQFLEAQRADPEIAAIPTVVISGSSLATDEEPQAAGYLRKPVGREHLLNVVSSYCTPKAA